METIKNRTESVESTYNRAEEAEQAVSKARELLAGKLDVENSTSFERITAITKLIKELSLTLPGTNIPIDNGNRHLVEALSTKLTLERMMQPLEEFKAKHPEAISA
jgi:hypothetical protein